MWRWRVLACGVAAIGACAPSDDDEPVPGDAESAASRGRVVSWPELAADCQSDGWKDHTRVLNGSAPELDAAIGVQIDSQPPLQQPNPILIVDIAPDLVGRAVPVDRRGASVPGELRVYVAVGNTSFSNRYAHVGETGGTLTFEALDIAAGHARIRFSGVRLLGEDSVYAGQYRCLIDGVADVELGRRAVGEACREDRECGGAYSRRICDFASLRCQSGCHDDGDCPLGTQCSANRCS